MSAARRRIVVLISGRGSNLAALIEAAKDPFYPGEIVGVVSDQADAPGLKIAESNGIPTKVVGRSSSVGKAAHEAAISVALAAANAEIVALAGYMRLLTPAFVERWAGRMINIHPALLPSFRGLDTHRRALDAGIRIHGCTVHFVTAETDAGPIIAQAAVPVLGGDSEASLAARVLKAEHRLYPLALALVCIGKARMENGRTVFTAGPEYGDGAFILAPHFPDDTRNLEDLARFTP